MIRRPPEKIHFIGIGGSGMSGLAEVLVHAGSQVSGSDTSDSRTTSRLRALGADVFAGHCPRQVPNDARAAVYSSAIPPANVELLYCRDSGIPTWHRSDLLAALLHENTAIVVCGTHGKTTTAAMISHILLSTGFSPTVVLGGIARNIGSSACLGRDPIMIIEADESDGTFCKYPFDFAVLTNIENDHLDYFGDEAKIDLAFREFAGTGKPGAKVTYSADCPRAHQVVTASVPGALSAGFAPQAGIAILNYKIEDRVTSFTARIGSAHYDFHLPLIGRHNLANAVNAIGFATLFGLDPRRIAAALATFRGVERRLAIDHCPNGAILVDDYAHNPGKIRASLQALREAFPRRRLSAVFQPHRYSRLRLQYKDMISAFADADDVIVLPVYAAGEPHDPELSPGSIAHDLRRHSGVPAEPAVGVSDAVSQILLRASPECLTIATLGAGDVNQVGKHLFATWH